MNTEETIRQLRQLKLSGMADRYDTIIRTGQDGEPMDYHTVVAMLAEAELLHRDDRKITSLIKLAHIRYNVIPSEVACGIARGLSRELWIYLCECKFIENRSHILILGPTGVGKSHAASALAYQACVKGYKTLYFNMNRLIEEIKAAQLKGTYIKLLTQLSKAQLLVLDDFGLRDMSKDLLMSLYEIMEERVGIGATIITSQLPINQWYALFQSNPTLGEAFLDRVTGCAQTIEMSGESWRKKKTGSAK
jgi:DNA replication protein DnaC